MPVSPPPIAPVTVRPASAGTGPMVGLSRMLRVLVLDDEVAVAETIAGIVRSMGVSAAVMPTAEALLAALPRMRPTHVILDLHMPGMNGPDVLHRMARQGSTATVIATSGHERAALHDMVRTGEALGLTMAGMLPKPFRIGDVARLLGIAGRENALADSAAGMATIAPGDSVRFLPVVCLSRSTVTAVTAVLAEHLPRTPQDDRLVDAVLARSSLVSAAHIVLPIASARPDWPALVDRIVQRCETLGHPIRSLTLDMRVATASDLGRADVDRIRRAGLGLGMSGARLAPETLTAMTRLPLDRVALHPELTRAIQEPGTARDAVRGLAALGRSLGQQVAAPGIATSAARDIARDLGCTSASGPFFGPPIGQAACARVPGTA